MEYGSVETNWRTMYKLMIGSIVPRPIGWVSTVDRGGRPNLAPFSFFNAVCANPPTLLFCPSIRGTDGSTKDTVANIRERGEFVVNIVTEATAEAMNVTSTELPRGVNEFELAGLTALPSVAVGAPRVAESPIQFECQLRQIIDINDEIGGGSVILGTVLHAHVHDSVLFDGDKIDQDALRPIGRLAGPSYCRTSDRFDMPRPPSQLGGAPPLT